MYFACGTKKGENKFLLGLIIIILFFFQTLLGSTSYSATLTTAIFFNHNGRYQAISYTEIQTLLYKGLRLILVNKQIDALFQCIYLFHFSYLLTPWSRAPLEKLTGSAASQEIPRIFGTRWFLTVPTSARHLSLS